MKGPAVPKSPLPSVAGRGPAATFSWASARACWCRLLACFGVLALAAGLAACDPEEPGQQPQSQQVQGQVTRQAVVPGATVALRDADGAQAQGSTNAQGRFVLNLSSVRWPAMLRIQLPPGDLATAPGANTLWAVLTAAPASEVLVTPLSSAAAVALTRGEVELAFQTLATSTATKDALAVSRLLAVEAALRDALVATAPSAAAASWRAWLSSAPHLSELDARLDLAGVADLLLRLSEVDAFAALVGLVAGQVATLPVGCDVPGFTMLADGSPRPACLPGSNTPLHLAALGSVRALPLADHTASADDWADMLSGRYRARHWKTYDAVDQPQARAQAFASRVQAFLEPRLSAAALTLLRSQDGTAGQVDALAAVLQRVDWRELASFVDFQDVSPTTHSWFALRELLRSEAGRLHLFWPSAVPASVRLMSPPLDHYAARPLTRMADFAQARAALWLADTGNRSGGAMDPAFNAVIDAALAMVDVVSSAFMDSNCSGEPCSADVAQVRANRLTAAVALVPGNQAALVAATQLYAAQFVESVRICRAAYLLPILTPARDQADRDCMASIVAWGEAQAGYNSAFVAAARASAEANANTPAAYSARFFDALRFALLAEIEQQFARYWTLDELKNSARFEPVVVWGDVRRGNLLPTTVQCCLRREEVEAPIDAVFYRMDGSRLEFDVLPTANGRTDPHSFAQVPIAMLEAELLSLAQGGALPQTPAQEWVLDVTRLSVQGAALACSRADVACGAALRRSRVLNAQTPAGSLMQMATGLTVVRNAIAMNNGIPYWALNARLDSR